MKIACSILLTLAVASCTDRTHDEQRVDRAIDEKHVSSPEAKKPEIRIRNAIAYLELGDLDQGQLWAQSVPEESAYYELAQLTLSTIHIARVSYLRSKSDGELRDVPMRGELWSDQAAQRQWEPSDDEDFVLQLFNYYRTRI